jgi:hypothetical protein
MYGIYENGSVIARFVVPMSVKSNQPIFSSDTLSLKRHVTRRSVQRWEIETNLEPLAGGAEDLFVNLVTKGYSDVVTVLVPQNYGAKQKRTSVSTPTAVGSAGTNVITVTNNAGLIPKGTFIRFANHSKVYMLTAPLVGSGPMSIYPTLRAPVNNTFNFRDDVIMDCLYDTDTITGMVYQDGILMDVGTVKLIEKL